MLMTNMPHIIAVPAVSSNLFRLARNGRRLDASEHYWPIVFAALVSSAIWSLETYFILLFFLVSVLRVYAYFAIRTERERESEKSGKWFFN